MERVFVNCALGHKTKRESSKAGGERRSLPIGRMLYIALICRCWKYCLLRTGFETAAVCTNQSGQSARVTEAPRDGMIWSEGKTSHASIVSPNTSPTANFTLITHLAIHRDLSLLSSISIPPRELAKTKHNSQWPPEEQSDQTRRLLRRVHTRLPMVLQISDLPSNRMFDVLFHSRGYISKEAILKPPICLAYPSLMDIS